MTSHAAFDLLAFAGTRVVVVAVAAASSAVSLSLACSPGAAGTAASDASSSDGAVDHEAVDKQCETACVRDPTYLAFRSRSQADAADHLDYYCADAILYECRTYCLADAGFVGPQEGQESYKAACAAAGIDASGSGGSCCPRP